ncbi:MAG: hypothetical protein AB7P76_03180 [Candidatus Melainabacteria bacterium]
MTVQTEKPVVRKKRSQERMMLELAGVFFAGVALYTFIPIELVRDMSIGLCSLAVMWVLLRG